MLTPIFSARRKSHVKTHPGRAQRSRPARSRRLLRFTAWFCLVLGAAAQGSSAQGSFAQDLSIQGQVSAPRGGAQPSAVMQPGSPGTLHFETSPSPQAEAEAEDPEVPTGAAEGSEAAGEAANGAATGDTAGDETEGGSAQPNSVEEGPEPSAGQPPSSQLPEQQPSEQPVDATTNTPNSAPMDTGAVGTDAVNFGAVDIGALEFSLQDGALEAREGEQILWRLPFPQGSGSSSEPLLVADRLYLGHGNSLLHLDPATGDAQNRWFVSGPVERVEQVDERTVAVTVRFGGGLTERFTLREDALQETARFGLEPEVFGYLRAEAQVPNPAVRLQRDPTNPWLYLAVGLQEADPAAARATFAAGTQAAGTFYDLAGLAQVLAENGERSLAEAAFDAALADFAARGYDPRLLQDPALEAAYNFPLEPLQRALAAEDEVGAGFWAQNLFLAAPDVPGAGEAFARYAALIGDAPTEEVAQWQARARGSASTGFSALDRIAGALGRVGWYADLAVLAAIFGLHLTLIAKYWRPQSSDLARAHAEKGVTNPLARLFALRYYTISEKLVLVLMFAAVLALGALAEWYGASSGLPLATRSGTLVNRAAEDYLERTDLTGARGAFIQGYAAQVAGDAGAQALLEAAGDYAPALNNLGALTGDSSLYSRALELDAGLAEARYNLGEQPDTFPFFSTYRSGEPVLAVPTQADFQNAVAGTWRSALAQAFSRPWLTLGNPAPFGINQTLWNALKVLFLLLTVVTLLFVFVPRPRSARNAPRTPLYHLLALLIPGSGLADEAWGLLLIVPWAVIGLDVLTQFAGRPFGLGITLRAGYLALGVIYLINTVAFFVELSSYRRRMRELERRASKGRVMVTKA